MKVTGYEITRRLRELQEERDITQERFSSGLSVYPSMRDKVVATPKELSLSVLSLEAQIALLQTIQNEYNLTVIVAVEGVTMSLAQAIKTVGGLGRVSKLWRNTARPTKEARRWVSTERSLDNGNPTTEDLEPFYDPLVSIQEHHTLERTLGHFRAAIQTANSQQVEMAVPDGLLV